MAIGNQINVEPLSYRMTGFKVEDLFLKEFVAELQRELPNSIIAHFCIGFTDSKDIISISYDRVEGKFNLERVDVEGTDIKLVRPTVEVLKKVLT